ncbi:MAG TPA: class I SAM-dependent methyltransferase [Chthoniobacterales bacterium]|jgi:SAM-dependent methyltransferase|nr:class I SAM-dependent methyltransferase [Chthoniobacterales bacterium]
MGAEPNVYSRNWFDFFHAGIDDARSVRETQFICRCAPLPEFRKILDVCCGMGRHARALSSRGYSIVGADRDADAIAQARDLGGGPSYVVADMRNYQPEANAFDAAIVMGQSFGHFDAKTNRDILRRLADGVRKRGRIILDLWNPEFFTVHQGDRELKTERGTVQESKRVGGSRLFVQLKYPNGNREQFEWQLFSPTEMNQLASSAGLALLVSCSGFDATSLPSSANPRIQFLLERAT